MLASYLKHWFKLVNEGQMFQSGELKKKNIQTLEALDWLRRSFCSKIFEYFLRSFLIICNGTHVE